MALSAFARTVILLLSGCILMVIGGGLIETFRRVIHNVISQKMPLKKGTESYDTWDNPPVPVYMEFWLFDLVNPDEVIKGRKPHVRQLGPYVYREVRTKDNITFYGNGTLSYKEPKMYVFDAEMSAGNETDTITTVNLLFLTVVDKLNSLLPEFAKKLEGQLLGLLGEHLFTKQVVHDLIWGVEVTALEDIKKILAALGVKVDIPDSIGLFAGQNGTDDGLYTIFTGTGNLDQLNIVDRWNGEKLLPYWNGDQCNMVNGTDGTLYHPFVQKTETLYLFSTDICRSIYATYDSDQWNFGINLYRFVPPPEVFANHTVNPFNIGYCKPECLGAGVLDISVCKGAPVIISQPHFYQGADYYINAIVGMHPNKDEHETFIDVEPNTGAVMNAAKRLQINVLIKNYTGIKDTEKMPGSTIFPIAWVNETAKIDKPTADKFIQEVMVPIGITQGVQYGLMIIGFIIIMVGIVYGSNKRVCHKRKSEYQSLNGDINPGDTTTNYVET